MKIAIVYFVALLVAVAAHGVQFDNPIDELVLLQRHADAKVNTSRARAHLAATYSRVQRNRQREGRQLHLLGDDLVQRAIAIRSLAGSLPRVMQDPETKKVRQDWADKVIEVGQGSVSAGKKMASGSTTELFEASSVLSMKAIVREALKEEALALRQQKTLDEDVDAVTSGGFIAAAILTPVRNAWHDYFGRIVSEVSVKSEAALAAAGGPGSSLLELGTLSLSEISDETVFALQQELDEVDEALRLEEEMILDVASYMGGNCRKFRDESHISKFPMVSGKLHTSVVKCVERYEKVAEIGVETEF